jgi:hypothetical protein
MVEISAMKHENFEGKDDLKKLYSLPCEAFKKLLERGNVNYNLLIYLFQGA